MRNITLHLILTDQPGLVMVYFEGSDSLGHRFWLFRQALEEIKEQLQRAGYPAKYAARLKRIYGEVIDRYYMKLDEIIGEFLQATGNTGHFIVLSDHGFMDHTHHYPVLPSVPFTGEHRLEGTLLINGPGIGQGRNIVGATLYHIAPTLAQLLGLSLDIPFEGSSLLPQVLTQAGQASLAAEEGDDEEEGVEIPFSDEEIDRLRSLGYVN